MRQRQSTKKHKKAQKNANKKQKKGGIGFPDAAQTTATEIKTIALPCFLVAGNDFIVTRAKTAK